MDRHYAADTSSRCYSEYVTVYINPRGSEGYGQEFTNAIIGDWGETPYNDLMSGLDYLLYTYDFIDKNRMAAMGTSYGGYMINYIAGHTDRFKCLISTCGIFNLSSCFRTFYKGHFASLEQMGENLNFSKENHEKNSPSNYVKNFKTPTLVIHGERDTIVPISESLQMFTALQTMNVPSKFIISPNGGHFENNLHNVVFFYEETYKWLEQWNK